MKECILEANLKRQGWWTTLLTILLVLTWDWDIFEKEGTSEKGCVEIEDWGFSIHLVLGFQENSIYPYVLANILQIGPKFIQKITPGFKNHMRNLDNFRQAVESPKSSNSMGYFCPKNIFLQLRHYIQRI